MSLEEKTIKTSQEAHQTGMKEVGCNGTSQCGEVSSQLLGHKQASAHQGWDSGSRTIITVCMA